MRREKSNASLVTIFIMGNMLVDVVGKDQDKEGAAQGSVLVNVVRKELPTAQRFDNSHTKCLMLFPPLRATIS